MPAPTADPPNIDRTRTPVAGAERIVTVGDRTFAEGDTDIQITHDGTTATFTVAFWNLAQDSFHEFSPGDRVEIRLGWDATQSERILAGELTTKRTSAVGADYKYVVTGRSDGATAVRQRLTASWKDTTPRAIVRDIASRVGLDVGYLGRAERAPVLDGYWQIRQNTRLAAWLDALAERASAETGRQYEWYTDRGALAFHPKHDTPDEPVRLTTADSILTMQPQYGDTTQTDGTTAHAVNAYVHPSLRKHATIEIAHTTGGKARRQGGTVPAQATPTTGGLDAPVRTYRCASYQFETGTTVGHHQCSFVVVPTSASYDHPPSRGGAS